MKYILVSGIQNSGSSAVYDYLSSREDCETPFGVNEFKLCSDPVGVHNLYLNFYKNYSFMSASNARYDFLGYVKKLENYEVYISRGIKKKLYFRNFYNISSEFIDSITKLKFYGRPEFSNFKISKFKNILLKLNNHYYDFFPIIIPVNKKKFIIESRKYINKIIETKLNKKLNNKSNIILNQSINIFDPLESSNYFQNRKIILVTRDPRDMYSSMKSHNSLASPHKNIRLFIEWYKHYFDNTNFRRIINCKNVLHIRFKNFVNNFNEENLKICKFIGINSKFKFKKKKFFDLEISRKNLYKYNNYLNKSENDIIKKELSKFIERK